MIQAEALFKSYDAMISESYESIVMNDERRGELHRNEKNIQVIIDDKVTQWYDMPLECIEGKTPAEFFRNISGSGEALELFKIGSIICESTLPDLFIEKLKSFGSIMEDELVMLAADSSLAGSEEDFYIPLTAIRLLGDWKVESAGDKLIELMFCDTVDNELFAEAAADAIAKIGPVIIDAVIRRINSAETITEAHKHLMFALAGLGRASMSDAVYKCLKNAFYKMEDKVMGAVCLGEYGDGRAVPALRGYLQKNTGMLARPMFYEIKSTIEKLGGNAEDIEARFQD